MPPFNNVYEDSFKMGNTTTGKPSAVKGYTRKNQANHISVSPDKSSSATKMHARGIAIRSGMKVDENDASYSDDPFKAFSESEHAAKTENRERKQRDNEWEGLDGRCRYLRWEYEDIENRVDCHSAGPKFMKGNTTKSIGAGFYSFVVNTSGHLLIGDTHINISQKTDCIYAGSVCFTEEGYVASWCNQTESYRSHYKVNDPEEAKRRLKMVPFPKTKFGTFTPPDATKKEGTWIGKTEEEIQADKSSKFLTKEWNPSFRKYPKS